MKKPNIFFLLSILCLLTANTAFADVIIGNGFTCNGNIISKGEKEFSYKKAKSNLANTLEKLKVKLSEAKTKKKKDVIKEQIKQAVNAKTLIKACSEGTLSPDQVDPIFTQLAANGGTYKGTYSGTAAGVIPLSGDIQFNFTLDGTVFGALLTIGGNLGNTLDAEPLAFSGDVGGIGFPAKINLPNTFLGSVTLSIEQNGHMTITNSGSSKGTVTFDGLFSSSKIEASLNGTYDGVPFQGTSTMNRQ